MRGQLGIILIISVSLFIQTVTYMPILYKILQASNHRRLIAINSITYLLFITPISDVGLGMLILDACSKIFNAKSSMWKSDSHVAAIYK